MRLSYEGAEDTNGFQPDRTLRQEGADAEVRAAIGSSYREWSRIQHRSRMTFRTK
jgi:hypothetical protein